MPKLTERQIFDRLVQIGRSSNDQGAVSACIVRRGKIIAETPSVDVGLIIHAEHRVLALIDRQQQRILPIDTLYTTLEPCTGRFDSHRGVADCTTIILNSGIRRVVYGATDPMQTVLTHARFNAEGVELLQTQDPEIRENCRRLFNESSPDYKV